MKIAILGCGYIGRALALKWKKKNYPLTATVQKPKDQEPLLKLVQKVYLLKSFDEENLQAIVQQNDVLVLTLSTDSPNEYEETFLKAAQALYKLAQKNRTPKFLIYTSRTSIYGEQNGLWVDEGANLKPISEADRILIETEKMLLSLKEFNWKVCVLRLAEVYGPDCEVSKKTDRLTKEIIDSYQNVYTNMIHLDDIVGIIDFVLNHKLGGVFNISDDQHPTLKEFLKEIYHALDIPPKTTWEAKTTKPDLGNFRVSNYKIKRIGYRLAHPDRVIN